MRGLAFAALLILTSCGGSSAAADGAAPSNQPASTQGEVDARSSDPVQPSERPLVEQPTPTPADSEETPEDADSKSEDNWPPTRVVSTDIACERDADCVPAGCCHADACVSASQAPECKDVMCTADCRAGTLDCGGGCLCQEGRCAARLVVSFAPQATPAE